LALRFNSSSLVAKSTKGREGEAFDALNEIKGKIAPDKVDASSGMLEKRPDGFDRE